MRLRSIDFAGYRSFAALGPSDSSRPLESLKLAPLTVLIGKNNSGKSTAVRLLHHVLLALGAEGDDPFPMTDGRRTFGTRFQDVQHGGDFFNPLDLDVILASQNGAQARMVARIAQQGSSLDERPPVVENLTFAGHIHLEGQPPGLRGLLPDVPDAQSWREGARRLLGASCHIKPIREGVQPAYTIAPDFQSVKVPGNNDVVAQVLLADVELRTAVGDWMEEHLEGWRVVVEQSLGIFKLLTRRAGREWNLADSGQGVQQVLPVATLCCWRNLGRGGGPFLDIVEQPELHLHDAAHAPLGDLLLSAVAGGQGNVVVETHSEALVLRLRRRIAEGLSPDQVALVYVEATGEGSRFRPIPIRDTGEVEWWPEGVFSEAFVEVKAIRRAQRARGES